MDIHVNLYMHIFIYMLFIIQRDKEKLKSEIMGLEDIYVAYTYIYIHTHTSEYLEYTHFII